MSFEIQVEKQLGDAFITTHFESESRLTALFGPSGAGKTSVLNMVAGLLQPDSGCIVIGGETLFDSRAGIDIPVQKRRAGYVFQDGRLFPHMTVRDNLLYGFDLSPPDAHVITLEETAGFLGIEHLLDRWPATLSGGEAQRTAIGRALLSDPRFLLMDEPLASLDIPRRNEILQVIERIRDQFSIPILYVSHDRAEVDRLAHSVVILD